MVVRIFISGNPRTGKTTLVKRIYEKYPNKFIGFWTEEIKEEKFRIGFKIKTTWNTEGILASIKERSPYRVGKYFIYPKVLDRIIGELEERFDKTKILLIDEIGRMEFYSKKFQDFINRILVDDSISILATVHRNYVHLVKYYIWLERDKWWQVYKKVLKTIENGI